LRSAIGHRRPDFVAGLLLAAAGATVAVAIASHFAFFVVRTMLHHVTNRSACARDVVRSVEPSGRIAVIDFAPGRL